MMVRKQKHNTKWACSLNLALCNTSGPSKVHFIVSVFSHVQSDRTAISCRPNCSLRVDHFQVSCVKYNDHRVDVPFSEIKKSAVVQQTVYYVCASPTIFMIMVSPTGRDLPHHHCLDTKHLVHLCPNCKSEAFWSRYVLRG